LPFKENQLDAFQNFGGLRGMRTRADFQIHVG